MAFTYHYMLAAAVALYLFVLTTSQASSPPPSCADQFTHWRNVYDLEIADILQKPRLNTGDLCTALMQFTIRVVEHGCRLNELQFAQLKERQNYVSAAGVSDTCWAVKYYPSSLQLMWSPSPVISTTTQSPPPTTTTTTTTTTLTTTTPAPTSPPSTATTASQQTDTTGGYTQCQLNVKNCFLSFHIALAGRKEPLNKTCDIIRSFAKCVLVYPECGFKEENRMAILQSVTSETIFQDWEPKTCNFVDTALAPTTSAPAEATTTPQSATIQEIGCEKGNFTCDSNDQCIPFAQVCDDQVNCQDDSDENRCTEPQFRMIVEIGQTFISYGCFDVVQGCATQYVMPLIEAGLQGPQPTQDALCKAYNQVLNCAIYESCPLSEKDRNRIAPKLAEVFRFTLASQSCTLDVTLPNSMPTSPPQTPISTVPPTLAPSSCVTSCANLNSGDYQSCLGCGMYASCVNGMLYDGRPCPLGLQWDDNLKRCDTVSTTCGGL